MSPSYSLAEPATGLHLAVIMDGNGRWGQRRGLPRSAGHHAGARTLRRVVAAAAEAGVATLTVYAFSADNWKRPSPEVALLLRLFGHTLAKEARPLAKKGIRLSVIGRRDRLGPELVGAIQRAEALTVAGSRMHLRVALDYSAREAIREAAPGPDVDLLIRTGGEQRLSDFLLWECAYAELYFTPCLWPDFGPHELGAALAEFRRRNRRYGGLPEVVTATGTCAGLATGPDGALVVAEVARGRLLVHRSSRIEPLTGLPALVQPQVLRGDGDGWLVLERGCHAHRVVRVAIGRHEVVAIAGSREALVDVAVAPEGPVVALAGPSGAIVRRGERVLYAGHPDQSPEAAVAIDAAGRLHVLHDATLYRLETAGWVRLLEDAAIALGPDDMGALVIGPDGAVAVTRSAEETVLYWQPETGERRLWHGVSRPGSPHFDAAGALWVIDGQLRRPVRLDGQEA